MPVTQNRKTIIWGQAPTGWAVTIYWGNQIQFHLPELKIGHQQWKSTVGLWVHTPSLLLAKSASRSSPRQCDLVANNTDWRRDFLNFPATRMKTNADFWINLNGTTFSRAAHCLRYSQKECERLGEVAGKLVSVLECRSYLNLSCFGYLLDDVNSAQHEQATFGVWMLFSRVQRSSAR